MTTGAAAHRRAAPVQLAVQSHTDRALIEAVRRDPPDQAALDALVRRHWPRLFARCRMLTQDVEDRLQPGFYGGAFRGPFFVLRHDPPPEPPVVKGVTGQFLDVGITKR